jgi:DNA-binding MarR family transcriptional regulator
MIRPVVNTRPLPFDAIAEARRQWEAHNWPAPEAMAAVTSIMRAQQIILARVDAVLRPFDLTFARYEALVLLYFSRSGALPLGKMGDRLMLHPTSVTNIIDRLEEHRLVRRTPHPTDRRTVLAEITDEGRDVVMRATKAVAGGAALGMGGLNEREMDRLTNLLRKLRVDAGDFPDQDDR